MSLKNCFLIFVSFLLLEHASAQTEAQLEKLNKLDEEAFVALESNGDDVTQKANALLKAGQSANSPIHQINAYTILGIINKNKGYYVTSVDFYNKALEVAEQTKDKGRISACYNNIGSVYQIQENYGKALDYYKRSLKIEETLNNPLQMSIRLYNIGDIYSEMDSLSLALSNFNSSLIIEKKFKNDEGIVYALLGITDVYLRLDRTTDASISLNDAKSYFDESDIEVVILYNLLQGQLLFREGEADKALIALRKAKQLSIKHDFKVHFSEIIEKEVEIKIAQEGGTVPKKKEEQKEKQSTEENDGFNKWLVSVPMVLIFVLAVVGVRYTNRKKKKEIAKNESEKSPLKKTPIFKLESDKGKIILELELNNVLCFEANDNYVNIYHLTENNEVKKSMERISLKKIEEQLTSLNGEFARVHKSYLINPNQISKIGGKAQAYRIHLEHLEIEIPVSRSFDISQIQG